MSDLSLKNKKLVLLDGTSYAYRAFHAIPDLKNEAGEPTGAVYGVLNMLRKLERELTFDYAAFVCDAPGKNFRHEKYPLYKANRKSLPEDLRQQLIWIRELVSQMGWKVLMVPKVEADDVIASLVKKAKQEEMEILISSGDKDLTQLVDERTVVIDSMREVQLDREGVKNKFGVFPEQIVDYLTLTGDTSDNVKGVMKCGPKTARLWLDSYGHLDNLLEHADDIKGKIGENLREAKAWLPLSRELIIVKDDVDLKQYLPQGLKELERQPINWQTLLPKLQRFGFKKWVQEAVSQLHDKPSDLFSAHFLTTQTESSPSSKMPVDVHYQAVTTRSLWNIFLSQLKKASCCAIDTETTSLNPLRANIVGLSFSFQAGKAFYIPLLNHPNSQPSEIDKKEILNTLRPYLEQQTLSKIGQNIKYDQQVLAREGITLRGVIGDSMLASYVIEPHLGHGLTEIAARHLDMRLTSYEDLCGKGAKQINFSEVPLSLASNYACQDADISGRLERLLCTKMNEAQKKIYHEVEIPLLSILDRMETTGVLIDLAELKEQDISLEKHIDEIKKEVFARVGQSFNLNSPKQLQEVLFTVLKIPTAGIKKTAKGDFSTSEEVLAQLAEFYTVPRLILMHRGLSKLHNTYVDKLPQMLDEQGRVHTNYMQAVTITGRLASNHPNLQNIPIRTTEGRRIRRAFIAPKDHYLLSADYSQIELRLMAHLSKDAHLVEAFANDEDIHASTAAKIFKITADQINAQERRYAKTINFGLIYGMGPYGLARALKISRDEAKIFITRYFAQYPAVYAYMQSIKQQAHQQGFVQTLMGRKLYLPDINSRQTRQRQAAERAAINAPMQGSAAELIKLAMINIQNWLDQKKLVSRMILQVHDELVFEVPKEELILIKEHLPLLMTEIMSLTVPLKVSIGVGKNWEEAH